MFKAAAAVLGIGVPMQALDEAAIYLRSERLVAKPKRRDRRLSLDEERTLLEYLDARRSTMPIADIVRFALASGRRQDEIVRLQWADLRPETGTALLRDVKHPTRKLGNDKRFRMLQSAWDVINVQPRSDDRVFPYEAKTVGTAFARGAVPRAARSSLPRPAPRSSVTPI